MNPHGIHGKSRETSVIVSDQALKQTFGNHPKAGKRANTGRIRRFPLVAKDIILSLDDKISAKGQYIDL